MSLLNKRVNYFDLGLHNGLELREFVLKIFPTLNIDIHNYFCYGFEACKKFADYNEYKRRKNKTLLG